MSKIKRHGHLGFEIEGEITHEQRTKMRERLMEVAPCIPNMVTDDMVDMLIEGWASVPTDALPSQIDMWMLDFASTMVGAAHYNEDKKPVQTNNDVLFLGLVAHAKAGAFLREYMTDMTSGVDVEYHAAIMKIVSDLTTAVTERMLSAEREARKHEASGGATLVHPGTTTKQ